MSYIYKINMRCYIYSKTKFWSHRNDYITKQYNQSAEIERFFECLCASAVQSNRQIWETPGGKETKERHRSVSPAKNQASA